MHTVHESVKHSTEEPVQTIAQPLIKKFSIKNLFGEKDINISFEENYLVILAENGSGKTTILNILNDVITKDFNNLCKYNFDEILILFSNNKELRLKRKNLFDDEKDFREEIDYDIEWVQRNHRRYRKYEDRPLSLHRAYKLKREFIKDYDFMQSQDFSDYQIEYCINHFCELDTVIKSYKMDWSETIDQAIDNKSILFLPTYRRIERSISSLLESGEPNGKKEDIIKSFRNIDFGMDDIQESFNKLSKKLLENISGTFSNSNSDILNYLCGSDATPQTTLYEKIRDGDLETILKRLGGQVKDSTIKKIGSLQKDNKIQKDKYHAMCFILKNLLDEYEKNKEIDDSINNFVDVTNEYLLQGNKKFIYSKSTTKLELVQSSREDKSVRLESLSSGEKQIVSIFAKLYLSSTSQIIIFDEPEISISVRWQEKILKDIIDSKNCAFLLCATHSPFVFSNQSIDEQTAGLSFYTTDNGMIG